MITLYSFVGVDRSVTAAPLFRKFLDFHQAQGIDRFVLDLHTGVGDLARVEEFAAIGRRAGARIRHVVSEPYSSVLNHLPHLNSFMQEYGSADAWCVALDSDEFVRFPVAAPDFLGRCDACGCNLVAGTLIDRFSCDAPFGTITDDSRLDDLFPVSYPLTRRVRRGWDRKIVAFKGRFTAIEGRHALVEEGGRFLPIAEKAFLNATDRIAPRALRRSLRHAYPYLEPRSRSIRRWKGRLEVHHIAWDSVLKRKMEARRTEPGCTYRQEILNVLAFVERADPTGMLKRHLIEPAAIGA